MDFKNVDWNKAVQNSLADYEKSKSSATTTERKEVDLTKYFTLALGEKENSGTRIIRILPLDTEGKWYEIVKFHNLKIGKRWQKLYDPAQDGEESPLNDMYKLLMKGDAEDKKIASNYRSRDFYIVRGIERGKEHEGVKFWRFPKVNDGSGIMDKIQPMMKFLNDKNPGSGAFFNPVAGRDLVISVVRDTSKGYTKVSQIIFDEPGAVSQDQEQMMGWLNDQMTWKDVYKKKPIEFLRIVAEGSEPVWDNEAKQFVAKIDDMGAPAYTPSAPAASVNTSATPAYSQPVAEPVPTELGAAITLDTDDLPF
jgi:hypothetical protein